MSGNRYTILIVADGTACGCLVGEALQAVAGATFATRQVDRLEDARSALAAEAFDLVLHRLDVPAGDGPGNLREVVQAAGTTPILTIARAGMEAEAQACVAAGAIDYVVAGEMSASMLGRAIVNGIERARSERALRASEERFRNVAEQVSEVIWISDASRERLVYISDAWEQLTGRSCASIRANTRILLEIIHPDDRADVAADFESLPPDGWDRQYRIVRPDGGIRWVRDRGKPTFGENGEIVRLSGSLHDITELHDSEDRYRNLFETMGQGALLFGRDGRVLEANRAAETILGLPLEKLRERTSADARWRALHEDGSAFPGEERPSTWALRTGREVDGVVMGVFNEAEQRHRWILLHARPHFRPGEERPWRVFTTFTDITALREAESAREASDERLRLIADTVRETFYLCDVEPLRMLYLSSAYERMWGRRREQMYESAERFFDWVHPEDLERVKRAVARRLSGEAVYCEYRIVCPGGDVRWVGDQSYPLEATESAGRRVVGSVVDITDRIHATERLRRSEERLARIVDTAAEAIVIVGTDGRINFANRAASEVLGLSVSSIVSRTFADARWRITSVEGGAVPADQLPSALVLASGRPVTGIEHAIEWPDGKRIIVSVNAAPLRGPGGDIEGVVATVRDVTAARDAAERVRFQATLLDAVGDAVVATDRHGRIVYWNRHAALLFGWSAEEVLGSSVVELIAGPDSARSLPVIVAAVQQGRDHAGELQLQRRTGESFPAFFTSAPVLNDAGEVVGLVGACSDLTELKRLQGELQQSQRMEAVGRLAGGVAHDFNNILTGIMGYSDFLMEELKAADPLYADVLEIRRAADRAAGLTRQLLAFSRKQVLQPRVVDLRTVVEGMEKMLGRLIGEDIEVAFEYGTEVGHVLADPTQIEQVVLNLAVNARDAMPTGGRLVVELCNVPANAHAAGAPQRVAVRVTDTGSGIPDAILPHIFEPFFTTKTNGRGTGLGLSTVYGIVTQSGGTIDVVSAVGRGTTFEVLLPTVDAAAERVAAPAAGSIGARGETVLLVEDDEAVRALTARILRRLGYTIVEASRGAEAIAFLERHAGRIDLLLTDVVMPGMSGPDLAARLTKVRPGLKVLFFSGYTDDFVSRHGVLAGGQTILEKPFSSRVLARRVRDALDGAHTPPAEVDVRALAGEDNAARATAAA